MASELVTLPIQSITLNFHLSCWQNRRARIYLDGVSLDQFHETLDVAAFAKHLVLSGKNLLPLPLGDVNGRASLFFHHGTFALTDTRLVLLNFLLVSAVRTYNA